MMDFNNIKKPYLIAEIGINHNADMQIIKKLIDASFGCQWDCVKFQKRVPEIATPEAQKNIMRETPWGKMTYLDYKKKMELGKEEFDYIDKYCKEKPIYWTVSVWDLPSLEFILQYDIPFIKIPSAKITEKELVLAAAKSGKPIMLSTGMSTLEEVDQAVNILKENGCSNFILMHCNSVYPATNEELNINCIKTLRERYNCPVGYSGHEYDLEPSVFAVILGAKVIERHITISHDLWGTDQKASLEVAAMDLLRKRLKDVDVVLGDGQKTITEREKAVREKLRGY
jgi:N-acetylneuraminate synthase